MTPEEIQGLEFEAEWNKEKITIKFNENLESPARKKLNKSLNKEGRKLVLENLQGTYFASIYNNGQRRTLIGIQEISKTKAVLFRFPEEPYQIVAK